MGVQENLHAVQTAISEACAQANRSSEDIQLVAVSKVHTPETIRPVLEAGHRVFGENRVQEAQIKWPSLKEDFPNIQLHLIGSLQTNKAKDAVALFDVIETVDRAKLAKSLASEAQKQGRDLSIFIQVNTGEEEQKGGCLPADVSDLVTLCRDELGMKVRGLMCIPPVNEEPALHFAFLRELARRHDLEELSMGMSGDYETAIRFGATSVRVGTAVFGSRPAK